MDAGHAGQVEDMTCAGYAEFLEHLQVCGGCTGEKRTFERCGYALHCATVEVMAKKGLVKDSKELLRFMAVYPDDSDPANLIDGRTTPRASLYGIGPRNIDWTYFN